jgi:hypothetical protein
MSPPPQPIDFPPIVSTPPPATDDFYSFDQDDDVMFWTTYKHDMENFELIDTTDDNDKILLTPPRVYGGGI